MSSLRLCWLLLAALSATSTFAKGNSNQNWIEKHSTGTQNDSRPLQNACSTACAQLQALFGAELANTTAYDTEKELYWSAFQAHVSPACFVHPSSARDVAEILRVVRHTHCPFAVKSGGHAAFSGASNIPGGITINLEKLNELALSPNQNITRVGTGNTWIDVYDYLTPKSLSVVGGRVAAIGTGGLTLGGGISFFSGRHSWACDGVQNYELVTADSEILQVNCSSHPDLFFALRGGGNNFGIVTRLDMLTFPQGSMWGGSLTTTSSAEENNSTLSALYDYAHRAPEDPDAALYIAFAYSQALDSFLINREPTHATNTPNTPPIFSNLTAISPSSKILSSTLTPNTNISALARAISLSNPDGKKETYWTATFKLPSPEILHVILSIFISEVENIKTAPGIVPALIFQILAKNTISHFSREGGNALGIDIEADEGPLLIVNVAIYWDDDGDTARDIDVLAAARNTIDKSVARAKEMGAFHRYIYQNYAAREQRVFQGYGRENLEKLRKISKKWDPDGVFQELQPGYHKLWW